MSAVSSKASSPVPVPVSEISEESSVAFKPVAKQGWKDTAITFGRKAGAVVVFATILPAVAKAINTFASSWNNKTNFVAGRTFAKENGFRANFGVALRKIGQVAARLFGLSTALEFLSRKPAQLFDLAIKQFNTNVVIKEVKSKSDDKDGDEELEVHSADTGFSPISGRGEVVTAPAEGGEKHEDDHD